MQELKIHIVTTTAFCVQRLAEELDIQQKEKYQLDLKLQRYHISRDPRTGMYTSKATFTN